MGSYNHVVRFRTSRSIARVEAWLSRNCRAAWTIRFEGVADDLEAKRWGIYFEDVNDVAAFKQAAGQPGMPDRPVAREPVAKPKKSGSLLRW